LGQQLARPLNVGFQLNDAGSGSGDSPILPGEQIEQLLAVGISPRPGSGAQTA